MFPPVFPFRAAGPAGGGGGVWGRAPAPNWAAGRPPAAPRRVRPAHPPPPRRAQPPFSCKNNLKKRP